MPFTQSQFLEVFARYNEGVWPAQVGLAALALATLALIAQGTPAASRRASVVLALLWAWMALGYHLAHFAAINPAAPLFAGFFLAASAAFAWHGGVRNRLRLSLAAPRARTGWALVLLALLAYPAIGYGLGHRYPAFPTFGLPCPTTIFTLGVLHFADQAPPRAILVVPLLWSGVGTLAAFQLGVAQDLALLLTGLVSIPLLFRTCSNVVENQSHLSA